ncbi:hypothetical protein C7271_21110 [filamentous cyanobacterium CCP5]|nr:hypothetical protein C7271_21110 [filamentous cyanobacterium CCP5]
MASTVAKLAIAALPLMILVASEGSQAASPSLLRQTARADSSFLNHTLAQTVPDQAELQLQKAALLYNQGDLRGTATLLESALATFLEGDDPNQIQQAAAFLGSIYGELGDNAIAADDLATALDYYQRQVGALSVGFNRMAEAEALIQAGRTALQRGQLTLAQNYLNTALEIAQEVSNSILIRQAEDLLNRMQVRLTQPGHSLAMAGF